MDAGRGRVPGPGIAASSGALLHGILRGGREVLLVVDADGVVRGASDASLAVLGWHPAEIAGRPLESVVEPGEDGALQARRRDGGAVRCEVVGWPLDGGRFAVAIRPASAEAALREDAEIAAALLHLGETLNQHLDEPYILDWVNTMARRLLACDASSVLGWDARRRCYRVFASTGVVGPDAHDPLADLVLAPDDLPLLRALEPGRVVEVVLGAAAERPLVPDALLEAAGVARLLCVPICRRRDVVGILLHGWRDPARVVGRRERRLALGIAQATAVALDNALLIADLQTASRLKSEFLTTLSHELRTPLNVVDGYGEMLADGACGPLTDAQGETLAGMRRATRQLLDLIEGTIDLSRLDEGERVACDPVDLRDLFAAVDAEVAPLVPEGVALRWGAPPPTPLRLDRRKTATVLKHLVGNGLKFTRAGEVAVAATVADGVLTLTVRDTGIGIAPEDVPVIFERFRQLDGSNTRRFGGMGLGLHVVKRLVEVMQGRVGVESAPGVGSTFTVTLPLDG